MNFLARNHGIYADSSFITGFEGPLEFESPVRFFGTVRLRNVRMGAFSYIGGNSRLVNCRIGRYCSIADNVTIGLPQHPVDSVSTHTFGYENIFPLHYSDYSPLFCHSEEPEQTIIEDGVWFGTRVLITGSRPIRIGRGSIIAAASVITRDVPPYSIVGGNPAKVIRSRFDEQTQQDIDSSGWWKYDWYAFAGKNNSGGGQDPKSFLLWWQGSTDTMLKEFVKPPEYKLLVRQGERIELHPCKSEASLR